MHATMNERSRICNGGPDCERAEVHLLPAMAVRVHKLKINVECLSVQFHIALLL